MKTQYYPTKAILTALLLGLIILVGHRSNAQVKIVNKQKYNIMTMTNTLKCGTYSVINLDNNDTSNFVDFTFRNEKYSTIVDTKSITINVTYDSLKLIQFRSDLYKVLQDIESEDELLFTRDDYTLFHSGGSPRIILGDPGKIASGIMALNNNQAIKLLNWIDELLGNKTAN